MPTLCQHNNPSYHYNKNNDKFGCSEEVLHVVRQFDTQTVHSDDQHWEDMRNLAFLDIWNEVDLSKKLLNINFILPPKCLYNSQDVFIVLWNHCKNLQN